VGTKCLHAEPVRRRCFRSSPYGALLRRAPRRAWNASICVFLSGVWSGEFVQLGPKYTQANMIVDDHPIGDVHHRLHDEETLLAGDVTVLDIRLLHSLGA